MLPPILWLDKPLPGYQIRIVDATGLQVGERLEGVWSFKALDDARLFP